MTTIDYKKAKCPKCGKSYFRVKEIKERLAKLEERSEIFEIFFRNIDFAATYPFNNDTRNRHGTFEWACKSLVSFRRNYSSSDNHTGSRQISSVK